MARIPEKFQLGLKKVKLADIQTKIAKLYADCFPEQLEFIKCPDKQVSALCSRRAGKTTACCIKLIVYCLLNPNKTCAYIGLTRESSLNTLSPIMQKLDEKYSLGFVAKSRPLQYKFPNGSKIVLVGLDDNKIERNKLRGMAFGLVVVDECGSFTTNLKESVHDVLMPTLMDEQGQLCLISTPGDRHGYFFDVTTERLDKEGRLIEPGWTNFRWLTAANPYMQKQHKEAMEKQQRDNPLIHLTPSFQREYLGVWTKESDKLMYKYEPQRNSTNALPLDRQDYLYTLAIDLGWNDANAFCVGAYSPTAKSPCLYITYAFKKKEMLMNEIVSTIRTIASEFKITKYVIDSAEKNYVQELEYRLGVALTPAPKISKWNYISMMNSDFITERIKLLPAAYPLAQEYINLYYDDSDPEKPREIKRSEDHLCDAALYLWRSSFHFITVEPVVISSSWKEKEAEFFEKLKQQNDNPDPDRFWFGD